MASKNSSLVLKILILLAKLKKPLLRKLVSLKKMKKLKLLEQYSYYSYVKEYEFSPSTTPIVEFRRISKYGRLSLRKLYSSLVLICKSLLGSSSRNKEIYQLEMGLSSSLVCAGEMTMISSSEDDDNDNDNSVDERAEIFIQRFYQEMRRQRTESNSQLLLLN
ncbi:hypothetical protein AAHA92_00038 [Salvia divinorum]|uniref:Cotton fiber protein n=1 Tax=Salvia divinorum TaxID=28513 RepID=A0ABD1II81_SALDI